MTNSPLEQFTRDELWRIRAAVERLFYEQDKMGAEQVNKTKTLMYKIWDMLKE